MKNKYYIYIDHNILFYINENNIDLKQRDDIEWVYSDEHFTEIERQNNTSLIKHLKDLKARKIKIVLNDKYQITNDAEIMDYVDPHILYETYLENISDTPIFNFLPLLSLCYSNENALDPDSYVNDFKSTLYKLHRSIFKEMNNPDLKNQMSQVIETESTKFKNGIYQILKDLEPLEKMRKKLIDKQCSNLEVKNGPIINQIWKLIKSDAKKVVTKEQLFGKYSYIPNKDTITPRFLSIAQCHAALNFIGYWPDKELTKLSKIYGIASDASHIGHASYCSALLTGDDRMIKKTSAIFNYFNCNTDIIQYFVESNTYSLFGVHASKE